MKASDEQQAIIDAARSGQNFKVYAGAGSGKTTTTRMTADAVGDSIYIAFNRSVKDDARGKFPASCRVVTAHGLAHQDIGREYEGRLTGSIWQVRRSLVERAPEVRGIADDVLATFATFLNSADARVSEDHVPSKSHDPARCAREAQRLFGWASSTSGDFPITHDVYLKVWQMQGGRIDAPTIFVDEAQDLSPVMLAVIQQQHDKQTIYVGDPFQQIYAWRGAMNALQSLDLPMLPLTSSWRFGQDVADVANSILQARKAPFTMRGMTDSVVRVGEDQQATGVIARTNAGLVASAISAVTKERSLHVLGGVEQLTSMLEGAYAVMIGERTTHPVFRYFASWGELQDAVEHSKAAREFKPVVKIVETYGKEIPKVCSMLKTAHVGKPSEADVTIGTTHKFKGQESERLQVIDDFQPFATYHAKSKRYTLDEETANIAYVAVTRAKERLTLSPAFAATLDASLKNTEQYWRQRGAPLTTTPRETLAVVIARGAEEENAQRVNESSGGATVEATIVATSEARSFVGRFVGAKSTQLRGEPCDLALVQTTGKLYAFREAQAFDGIERGTNVAVMVMRGPTPKVVVFAEHGSAEIAADLQAGSTQQAMAAAGGFDL